MANPKVFISYSHDSPDHANRVLELSNQLRSEGIDCTIDQYEVSPSEGWPKWMDRQIANSDFVLVVCTETYHRRVMGEEGEGKGQGVKWESTIAYQDLYDNDSINKKFIPILFEGNNSDFIPKPIKGATRYTLTEQYDDLYRHLTNQPKVIKPELGSIKKFEPLAERERKTDFFEGTTAGWHLAHPYPMPPNFTGRATELEMLDNWLADNTNRLFILRALGGFGKSALTWQWINTHVNPAEWTKLVWWSFYEGDASFEHFIEETLKYLKLEVPQGQRPQVDELLKAMGSQKILLIMDGFERALRAYSSMNAAYQGDSELPSPLGEGLGGGVESQLDCVNINAEIFLKSVCSLPNIKSKVLMTTRLTPRAVKPRGEFMLGCCEVELTSMQSADAVEFFHKQGIKGTHVEIEAACAPYGYHPLSLRLLAGRILKDFENPADIVVSQKLKIDGDIVQLKHHVLEVSYNSLPLNEQKLLSTIACFRSPVELKTLEAVAENKNSLNENLHDLVARGLLHFDEKNKKFDLHPIVRVYSYERMSIPDRTATHEQLANYFESIPLPKKVEKLEDLASVIERYFHTAQTGYYNKAKSIFKAHLDMPIYFQFGAYELQIELLRILFPDDEDGLPRLKDEINQLQTINDIATAYSLNGNPRRALSLFAVQNKILEEIGNQTELVVGLENIASMAQLQIGDLQSAESNLRQSIRLCNNFLDAFGGATYHLELGRVMGYLGDWDQAEEEIIQALQLFEAKNQIQAQCVTWAYRAQRSLQMVRDPSQSTAENIKLAITHAQRSLEFAENTARELYPFEYDFIRAHWILGTAYKLNNQLDIAEQHLSESLARCRTINNVEQETNILLNLAHLRYDQKKTEEAKSLAEEALLITERCGYVLQGADVNLFLAQYALEQEKNEEKAKQHAEEALKLAACDGPPYYYKVAYEEAESMLKKIG